MGARRRGSPSAVERCSYPEIMSGLHLLYPQTSSFRGCWYRSLYNSSLYPDVYIPESLRDRSSNRQGDKRHNGLIVMFSRIIIIFVKNGTLMTRVVDL